MAKIARRWAQGVGKGGPDCGGRCRCFVSDSAVARLAWHLGTSARWGVSSERRRKDVLRLQFAALTRLAFPLVERQRKQLLVVQREIAALDPLARTPQRESRALGAFRRSLGGPSFRTAFERWYKQAVDPTPLRAFIAEFADDKTPATHRAVRFPHNGRPPHILTLSRDECRALVKAALAEVQGKLEDEPESSASCPFDRLAERSIRLSPSGVARDVLAALLNISTGTLAELERGRQKPRRPARRRTLRRRVVRGAPSESATRTLDADVLALGHLVQDPADPLRALLARDALEESARAAIRRASRQPGVSRVVTGSQLANLARPSRSPTGSPRGATGVPSTRSV